MIPANVIISFAKQHWKCFSSHLLCTVYTVARHEIPKLCSLLSVSIVPLLSYLVLDSEKAKTSQKLNQKTCQANSGMQKFTVPIKYHSNFLVKFITMQSKVKSQSSPQNTSTYCKLSWQPLFKTNKLYLLKRSNSLYTNSPS